MINLLVSLTRLFFLSRAGLAAENLALRHQLIVLKRSVNRPRLRIRDRLFWVWLAKVWPDWRSCLVFVRPESVVKWHHQGFKL